MTAITVLLHRDCDVCGKPVTGKDEILCQRLQGEKIIMTIKTEHKEPIQDANTIYLIMSAILNSEDEIDRNKEHFWSIGLNAKNQIQYIELVSLGTLSNSLIHPRETFRFAIMKGVANIIVCHNHPSGGLEPSREDIAITERLVSSGEILGIKVLDHVIIGSGYLSMMEKGLLKCLQ